MKSLHNVAVLAIVVALLGSIGVGAALQQQASAQGIIVDYKEFTKLTNEFEEAVSDAAARNNMKEIGVLLDEYNRNVMIIFDIQPPKPNSDLPGETDSSEDEDDDEPRTPGAR